MSDEWTSETNPSEKNLNRKMRGKKAEDNSVCFNTKVRSLSSVRFALIPSLIQAPCSSVSEHALMRGLANAGSVHIVAFRRRAWTFTYADITLVRCGFCCCSSEKQFLQKHIKKHHLGSRTFLTSSQLTFTLKSLPVEN